MHEVSDSDEERDARIGAVLRALRMAVDRSSGDVTKEVLRTTRDIKLSPDYLLKIERGERGNEELWTAIAGVFDVDLKDVISLAAEEPAITTVTEDGASPEAVEELVAMVDRVLRPRTIPKPRRKPRSSSLFSDVVPPAPGQAAMFNPSAVQASFSDIQTPSEFPAAVPGFSGTSRDLLQEIADLDDPAKDSVLLVARAALEAVKRRKPLAPLWDPQDGEVRETDVSRALVEHLHRLARLGVPGWPLVDLPVGQIAYVDGGDVFREGDGVETTWWVRKRAWALRLGQRHQHVAVLVLPGDQLLVDTTSAGEILREAPLSLVDQWRPAEHTGELPPAFPREAYTETVVELHLEDHPVWTIVPCRADGEPVEPVENPIDAGEILDALGVDSIGIVSAWNPGGRQLSREENERRDETLRTDLGTTLDGFAVGRESRDREEDGDQGLVVPNATPEAMHRIARNGVQELSQNGGFLLDRGGWKVVLALTEVPVVLTVPMIVGTPSTA